MEAFKGAGACGIVSYNIQQESQIRYPFFNGFSALKIYVH